MRRPRPVRRFLALVLLAAVVYTVATFVQVVGASRRDQTPAADAILVLGAAQYDGRPSPVLRARLDHALDLYKRDVADVVVVTGGRAPGDRVSEATASADYLMARGVPDAAILREVHGRDSWQSLASASNELRKRDLRRVVLVSDPFHNARIAAIAEELGLEAHVSPTRTSPIGGGEELAHFGRETAAVAVGRIVGFRRLMGINREVQRVRDAAAGLVS